MYHIICLIPSEMICAYSWGIVEFIQCKINHSISIRWLQKRVWRPPQGQLSVCGDCVDILQSSSSANLFQVILSGTQPCASINTPWFVRGVNKTGAPSECTVHEKNFGNHRICDLTCRCAELRVCGYLHFRAQFPPWVTTTLSLCHYVLKTVFSGFINPELVVY